MLKTRLRSLSTFGLAVTAMIVVLNAPFSASGAQNSSAPDSLAGSLLTLKAGTGQPPFEANGVFRLFVPVPGTNYLTLGRGCPLTSGSMAYAATPPNLGIATMADAALGSGTALQLAFGSPTNGVFTLTYGAVVQIGTFTLTRYADLTPSQLFLPTLTDGRFQSYLSGQPGFVYAVETSSNLFNWLPWRNVPLAELTTDVTDTGGGAPRFYRARLVGTAFAPPDLTNKTFSLTVSEGQAPLATNGICQWLADTNGLGYQIIGGPGTTNSSGNYVYTRTGPDTGVIACQDSVAGTVHQQLVFTSPQSGYFYATNTKGYEAGTFTMADGPVEFLGNVRFTPDAGRARSIVFPADGSPATLSVTNAGGGIWTLDFPADALAEPRMISMTPFATVDSSQSLLPLAGGVSLDPDGLQFDNGVTLTARPPGPLGANAALMLADGDGRNLYFVGGTNETGALSATLFHFSGAGATDPSNQQWSDYLQAKLESALAAYAQATNDIQALMKNATNQPPPPPDYVWVCAGTNGEDQMKIDKYISAVFAREDDAIRRLMSAAWELKSLGPDYTTNANKLAQKLIQADEFAQITNLFVRYFTLATNVDVEVEGDSYKFMALYRLSSRANQELVRYGGRANSRWTSLCNNWSKFIRDGFVREVRDRHLYSKAQVAINVETFRTTVMNIAPDTKGSFASKLAKAQTFKLSTTIKTAVTGPGGAVQVNTEFKGDETFTSSGLTFAASNNFAYVSGTWVGKNSSGTCTYQLNASQTRPIEAWMYLQLCGDNQSVTFCVPMWLAAPLVWTGCQEHPEQMSPVITDWDQPAYNMVTLMAAPNPTLAGYTWPLPDGKVEIVNETIQLQANLGTTYSMTFKFQLEHKPR